VCPLFFYHKHNNKITRSTNVYEQSENNGRIDGDTAPISGATEEGSTGQGETSQSNDEGVPSTPTTTEGSTEGNGDNDGEQSISLFLKAIKYEAKETVEEQFYFKKLSDEDIPQLMARVPKVPYDPPLDWGVPTNDDQGVDARVFHWGQYTIKLYTPRLKEEGEGICPINIPERPQRNNEIVFVHPILVSAFLPKTINHVATFDINDVTGQRYRLEDGSYHEKFRECLLNTTYTEFRTVFNWVREKRLEEPIEPPIHYCLERQIDDAAFVESPRPFRDALNCITMYSLIAQKESTWIKDSLEGHDISNSLARIVRNNLPAGNNCYVKDVYFDSKVNSMLVEFRISIFLELDSEKSVPLWAQLGFDRVTIEQIPLWAGKVEVAKGPRLLTLTPSIARQYDMSRAFSFQFVTFFKAFLGVLADNNALIRQAVEQHYKIKEVMDASVSR